jgi:hypothetical protein
MIDRNWLAGLSSREFKLLKFISEHYGSSFSNIVLSVGPNWDSVVRSIKKFQALRLVDVKKGKGTYRSKASYTYCLPAGYELMNYVNPLQDFLKAFMESRKLEDRKQ